MEVFFLKDRNRRYIGKLLRIVRSMDPQMDTFELEKVQFIIPPSLTRAPLGYFYNAPPLGGGGYFEPPPLISETTGPILKIQEAFESPGKTVEGKQISLTSGSRVTSQVRSK